MNKLQYLERFYWSCFCSTVCTDAVELPELKDRQKIMALAKFSNHHPVDLPRIVEGLCQQARHIRRGTAIIDDVIDEDEVREGLPSYWVKYGYEQTLQQGAWEIAEARAIIKEPACIVRWFDRRFLEIVEGAQLEVEMEDPSFVSLDMPSLWFRIVRKEASLRIYWAEALLCPPYVREAAYTDAVAAQILDDALEALAEQKSEKPNSDTRLRRLTYMRAFGVSPEEAEAHGRALKQKTTELLGIQRH